jgi:hypothetical protein
VPKRQQPVQKTRSTTKAEKTSPTSKASELRNSAKNLTKPFRLTTCDRLSEGMSQFLALATGREDPAIAEYRKQTQKLEELKAELRALQQEKVEILGGAA